MVLECGDGEGVCVGYCSGNKFDRAPRKISRAIRCLGARFSARQ